MTVLQDLRYAARTFLKWPAFTLMAVITLGLGIGATTALFSVVNAVLLRPLPYPDSHRLVAVWETDRNRGTDQEGASPPDFFDWRSQGRQIGELAAHLGWQQSLTGGTKEPERITGASVTENFFPMLRFQPFLGRNFLPAEDRPGGDRVAIVSYGFWRARFGADPGVLGQTITLDGIPYKLVGVMPSSFLSPGDRSEVCWIPLQYGPTSESRGRHVLLALGRLAPGSSREKAQAEMTTIAKSLEREYPEDNAGRGVRVQDLREADIGPIRPALLVLLSAVGAVLLITCVNLANALLARALSRKREIAIRTALGASRPRLVRQLLTESLLLAGLGGVLGLFLASWGVRAIKAIGPATLPRMEEIGIDGTVLVFMLGVTLLTSFLFGLAPALQLSRPDLQVALKDGGATTSGPKRHRMRGMLVITEVALATLIAIGAGLLVKSLSQLQSVDPGFEAENLLKLELELPEARYPPPESYPDWPQVSQFNTQLLENVKAIPGVESVALALNHPLKKGWTTQFTVDGRPSIGEGERDEARLRPVTPGYFRTVRQPLLQGRDFTEQDDFKAPPVILVNRTLAQRYFSGENPVGRKLSFWGISREIVGVVGDVKFMGLTAEVEPAIYPPLRQIPMSEMSVLVRTHQDPASLADSVRQAIWKLDQNLAISGVMPMEEALSEETAQPRFNTYLLGFFAMLALVLAVMGIYGLVLYTVGQQTQEIGVRMALGARPVDVLKMIITRGMALVLVGLVAGLFAAFGATRLMSSLLFGVAAGDWEIFLLVALVLSTAGVLACSVPSLRAARVSPVVATKYE